MATILNGAGNTQSPRVQTTFVLTRNYCVRHAHSKAHTILRKEGEEIGSRTICDESVA